VERKLLWELLGVCFGEHSTRVSSPLNQSHSLETYIFGDVHMGLFIWSK